MAAKKKAPAKVKTPARGKPKPRPKPKPKHDFSGKACEVCGREWQPGRKFVMHHLVYEPEITAPLCWACHTRLHAQGAVFNHPFKRDFDRGTEPYIFAVAVCDMYERLVMVPMLLEQLDKERLDRMERVVRNASGGTIH